MRNAWELNGSTSYAEATFDAAGATTLTFEAWVRVDTNKLQLLLYLYESTSTANAIQFRLQSDGDVLIGRNLSGNWAGYQSTSRPISTATWHHVVAELGTGGYKMWVDNNQVYSNSTSSGIPNLDRFCIGSRINSNDRFLDGQIARATVFSGALSDADRQTLLTNPPTALGSGNILAYYELDSLTNPLAAKVGADLSHYNLVGLTTTSAVPFPSDYIPTGGTVTFNQSGAAVLLVDNLDRFPVRQFPAGRNVYGLFADALVVDGQSGPLKPKPYSNLSTTFIGADALII
ncbi:LamG domain-containing protein [Ferrimonas balearica]|uniref:LamG domain-containing protein n=1 Tax=Ferrimonas balearica TaxID=44012 RepID=UPI002D7F6241|nr:LamG domain-containing protein [Ferrimonas balearica]MBY6093844.1 LamG domain-containing protein [Ferrimonas balearica]